MGLNLSKALKTEIRRQWMNKQNNRLNITFGKGLWPSVWHKKTIIYNLVWYCYMYWQYEQTNRENHRWMDRWMDGQMSRNKAKCPSPFYNHSGYMYVFIIHLVIQRTHWKPVLVHRMLHPGNHIWLFLQTMKEKPKL